MPEPDFPGFQNQPPSVGGEGTTGGAAGLGVPFDFPGVNRSDPRVIQLDNQFRLARFRAEETDTPENPIRSAFRQAMPFGGMVLRMGEKSDYDQAVAAMGRGDQPLTDDALRTIARYEGNQPRTFQQEAIQTIGRVPALLGEMAAAGPLIGEAGAAAGQLATAVAPRAIGTLAPLTASAGARGLTMAATTSMGPYEAIASGEQIGGATAHSVLNATILGNLGAVVNRVVPGQGIASAAARTLAGGIIMPLEQQVADAVTTVAGLDKPEAELGVAGTWLREGPEKATHQAALQMITGLVFTGAHDLPASFGLAITSLRRQGLSQEASARQVSDAVNAGPQARQSGPVADYVRRFDEAVQRSREVWAPERPEQPPVGAAEPGRAVPRDGSNLAPPEVVNDILSRANAEQPPEPAAPPPPETKPGEGDWFGRPAEITAEAPGQPRTAPEPTVAETPVQQAPAAPAKPQEAARQTARQSVQDLAEAARYGWPVATEEIASAAGWNAQESRVMRALGDDPNLTLEALGRQMGVTGERIRQIATKAMGKAGSSQSFDKAVRVEDKESARLDRIAERGMITPEDTHVDAEAQQRRVKRRVDPIREAEAAIRRLNQQYTIEAREGKITDERNAWYAAEGARLSELSLGRARPAAPEPGAVQPPPAAAPTAEQGAAPPRAEPGPARASPGAGPEPAAPGPAAAPTGGASARVEPHALAIRAAKDTPGEPSAKFAALKTAIAGAEKSLSKSEVVDLAKQLGARSTGSKADILRRIENREGEAIDRPGKLSSIGQATTEAGTPIRHVGDIPQSRMPEPPKPPSLAAMAHEEVAGQRESRTFPAEEIERQASVGDKELAAQARARVAADPAYPEQLVRSLEATTRPPDRVESMVLLHHLVDLRNARENALDNWLKADFGPERQALGELYHEREQRLDGVERLLDRAGSEMGSILRLRRMIMAEDFSLAGLLKQARAAKGSDLTPDEVGVVERLQRELKAAKDALDKAQGGEQPAAPAGQKGDMTDLRVRMRQARQAFDQHVKDFRNANKPLHAQIWTGTKESWDLWRALKTAWDDSAVLRQGAVLTAANPIKAYRAFIESLRSGWNEARYERTMQQIRDRPNFEEYKKKANLYLSDITGRAEEVYSREGTRVGNFIRKWLGINMSERAYNTFLNLMRADVYDSLRPGLGLNPGLHELQALGNFINVSTGRSATYGIGSLPRNLDPAIRAASHILFSPQFLISRAQLLVGQPLYSGSLATRKLIGLQFGKAGLSLMAFYGAAKLFGILTGDDVKPWNYDPRSSDFGKIVIGKTRIDPLAGLSQLIVFLSRLATGSTVSTSTGQATPLRRTSVFAQEMGYRREQPRFGGRTVQDVESDFQRSKLAPLPGFIEDMLTGEDYAHNPITDSWRHLGSHMLQQPIPMIAQDVYKAVEDLGAGRGSAASVLGILGMSLQTYEQRRR